jgi:C-terminal processing protease CtpA/Prc
LNSSWGSVADVDANLGAKDTLLVDHRASVASVVQHGATLAAAILVGDLIVQIDNTPVTDPQWLGLAKRWRNIVMDHSKCASGSHGMRNEM